MNDKIKPWYLETFKTDELGHELDDEITFKELYEGLEAGEDFYILINTGDSLVRERLFYEIGERMLVGYNKVYELWIRG